MRIDKINVVCSCLILIGLGACTPTPQQSLPVTKDSISFDPVFKPTTDKKTDFSIIVPAKNLSATAIKGTFELKWSIPKYYTQPSFSIGYRIYVKSGSDATVGGWDFSSPFAIDRASFLSIAAAADKSTCAPSGECRKVFTVGGPKTLQIAILTTDSLDLAGEGGRESAPVATIVSTLYQEDDARYNIGFIDGKFGGALPGLVTEEPTNLTTYKFNTNEGMDPWLLPADGFIASDHQPNYTAGYGLPLKSETPILTSVDMNGDASTFSDKANHRIILKTRPRSDGCKSSIGSPFYDECLARLRSVVTTPFLAIGQPTAFTSYPYELNPLGPTRSIQGGTYASSVLRDESGEVWFVIADKARLLIRKGLPESCALEDTVTFNKETGGMLTDGRTVGPEGSCGFQWSIGTSSPRLTCGLRADGSPANTSQTCTGGDDLRTLADSQRPSSQSLRYPGSPAIVGRDLYIPDGGNARVVRLANFKTALLTCGRLKAASEPFDPPCVFDRVIGQTESSQGAQDQMSQRKCVRGGERGGRLGLATLPDFFGVADPLEPVCGQAGDPACAANTGTGIACLLDTVTETVSASGSIPEHTVFRRSRQALDFKNASPGINMMSPSTGLLDDKALAMFRFPVSVQKDYKGRLLVTDMGQTFAQESSLAPSYSVLGTRVMVWNRDPLSVDFCPINGNCEIAAAGACVGVDCINRVCLEAECQAYTIIGQKNAKFTHGGFVGLVRAPADGANGFIPIVAVSIPVSSEGRGVWAVTGKNRHIYRWKNVDQFEPPDLHNKNQDNGLNGEVMLDGAFSGIAVDTSGGFVGAFDSLKSLLMTWFAKPSDQAANPVLF